MRWDRKRRIYILGSRGQSKNVLNDLRRRKRNWLRTAAKDMAKCVERDWKDYKEG